MEHTKQQVLSLVRSSAFQRLLIGLGTLVIALLIFQAGVAVGFRKASFAFEKGDRYYRAFEGGRMDRPMMPGFPDDGSMRANGTIGKVLVATPPTFIIEDKSKVEQIVRVNDETIIRSGRQTVTTDALTENTLVVVFGKPNDAAEIDAKLIRILPPPPEGIIAPTMTPN